MNSAERRNRILKHIEMDGRVSVDHLLQQFHVSVETIRRDLRILNENGVLKRVYGGAVKQEKSIREIPYGDRLIQSPSQKEWIGKRAVSLLETGDCLFVDGKTTCLAFISAIPKELKLTIVTNSIMVAYQLMRSGAQHSVFLVGGEVDEDGLTSGPKLHQELKGYRFDKAFFSSIAVSEKGCFHAKTEPQQLAQTLLEVSSSLILLADSSKFNKTAFLLGLDLDCFDYIVTDAGVPESFLQAIKTKCCKVLIAEEERTD